MVKGQETYIWSAMNRREFLKLGGAGLAGAMLLGGTGCGSNSSRGKVALRYALWNQNQVPAPKMIIAEFQQSHPDIQVKIEDLITVFRFGMKITSCAEHVVRTW